MRWTVTLPGPKAAMATIVATVSVEADRDDGLDRGDHSRGLAEPPVQRGDQRRDEGERDRAAHRGMPRDHQHGGRGQPEAQHLDEIGRSRAGSRQRRDDEDHRDLDREDDAEADIGAARLSANAHHRNRLLGAPSAALPVAT